MWQKESYTVYRENTGHLKYLHELGFLLQSVRPREKSWQCRISVKPYEEHLLIITFKSFVICFCAPYTRGCMKERPYSRRAVWLNARTCLLQPLAWDAAQHLAHCSGIIAPRVQAWRASQIWNIDVCACAKCTDRLIATDYQHELHWFYAPTNHSNQRK